MSYRYEVQADWKALASGDSPSPDHKWNIKCAITAAANAKEWAEASKRWEEAGYKVRYNETLQIFEEDKTGGGE